MNHKLALGLTLLMGIGLLTSLNAAPRTVLCEVLYQET